MLFLCSNRPMIPQPCPYDNLQSPIQSGPLASPNSSPRTSHLTHSTPAPLASLCSSHMPGSHPTPRHCTCSSLCLECPSPREPQARPSPPSNLYSNVTFSAVPFLASLPKISHSPPLPICLPCFIFSLSIYNYLTYFLIFIGIFFIICSLLHPYYLEQFQP